MATTQNTYTGNGSTTNFSFTFEYIDQSDVKVTIDSVATTAFTFSNATTLSFASAPASGKAIRIYRDTDITNLNATFFPGSAIKAEDLNNNFAQTHFATQETDNEVVAAITTSDAAKTLAENAVTTSNNAVTTANSASAASNSAVTTANTASTNASAAVTTANAASVTANNASSASTTAVTTANSAVTTATNALTTADSAVATANSADNKSNAAVTTANTALTNSTTAVGTSNSASAAATSAVNTANSAVNTADSAVITASSAVSTANSAVSTANTASTNASTAVSTANTASTNASTAVTTANTAATDATTAVTTANSAVTTANTASTTANTASTTANVAAALANTATTTANGAVTTANTADTNASAAVVTANAASTAVSAAVLFTLIANVAGISSSPSNNDYIEIGDSTGIQSFTPLSGLPSGFSGASGLTVRLRYETPSTSWVFMNYFANDTATRYLTKNIPVVIGDSTNGAGQITLNCEHNTHGVSIQGPPHSATAIYTLTLPDDTGSNGQFLKTDGTGYTSWAESPVTSVASKTGAVTLAKGDVGLSNCDDTSDANKPVSSATQTALNAKADLIAGKLNASQLPDLAISEYKGNVADQTAMLAVTGEKGDWVIRNDDSKVYVISGADSTSASDWTALSYPAGFSGAYNDLTGKPTIPSNNNQLTNGAGYVTSNTQLSNEQVQDIVGGMVSGNSESGITVTYQDDDGTIDFSVASQTDQNFTNADHTKLDGIETGATGDQTAAEILTAIKTVDGAGSGLDADTLDGVSSGSFLRSDTADTFSGDLTSSGSARLLLKKTDNNVSDHIIFYNGTTRIGEIGCHDTTWLRLNQSTATNIYTPRYIRADAGFYVDGTTKGINGSGNYIGGTIAGASDYGTLLRSNANDTATGEITFNGRVNIRGHLDFADSEYAYFGSSDDWQIHRNANNWTYINDKGAGIIFQDNGTNKMRLEDSGIFRPETTATGTIGTSSYYWSHGYFSNATVSATLNVRGAIDLADNDILRFGSGDDAEFFCNGSHLYLDLNSGIGNFYIRDGSTTRYTFNDNGSFTATGNITAYSDIKLKDNITPIPDSIEKVKQIHGVTFDRIDTPELGRQMGVIAQDVEKVCPELVSIDEDGTKSVAYGHMVGLLIEAIKDQQKQIDKLKVKLEEK